MRIILGVLAALCMIGASANAGVITNYNGLEMTVELTVLDNGAAPGGSFTAYLVGSDTAVIGDGHEFTFYMGAPGLYSYSSGYVTIDIMDDGTIEARSTDTSYTAVGSTRLDPFSFSLSFSFTDPNVEVRDYETAGDLARGDASVSGFDPILWTFVSERDNAFGNLLSFNGTSNPIPSIRITEAELMSTDVSEVPLPAAAPLLIAGLGALGLAGRRRKQH